MTNSQIFWRRVWLITAAVLIVAAYVNGFRISNAILSSDCRLATILTFASSFCLVMGTKECAKDYFNIEDKLWYASFAGSIFISFILIIFVSIFLALTTIIIDPSVKRALYPEQMQFLLPAFTILLIVILNRPHLGFSRQYYPPKKVSQRRSYAQHVASSPPIKQRIETGKYAAKKVRDSLGKGIGLLKRK